MNKGRHKREGRLDTILAILFLVFSLLNGLFSISGRNGIICSRLDSYQFSTASLIVLAVGHDATKKLTS